MVVPKFSLPPPIAVASMAILGTASAADLTLTADLDLFTSGSPVRTVPNKHWYGPAVTDESAHTGNSLTVQSVKETEDSFYLFGGYGTTNNPNVSNNFVYVTETNAKADLIYVYAGHSNAGTADSNTLTVEGNAYINQVWGGWGSKGASNNTVKIFGRVQGTTSETLPRDNITVYGGAADFGAVNNNTVIIGDSVTVFQAEASHLNDQGTINGNKLVVQDDAVVNRAYAAFAGYYATPQSVKNNTLVVKGHATIASNSSIPNAAALVYSGDNVTGNVVQLQDQAVVRGVIYGAYDQTNKKALNAGNSIEVSGTVKAGGIDGFDTLTVYVAAGQTAPVLTITDEGDLDLSGRKLILDGEQGLDRTKDCELIALDKGGSVLFGEDTEVIGRTTFVDLEWMPTETAFEGGLTMQDLGLRMYKPKASAKTLSETFLGSIAFLQQGADFIADEGLRAMRDASLAEGSTVFGAMNAGTMRIDTGSHVDIHGSMLVAGVATRVDDWILAGFIEAGKGSSESNVDGASGDGDHDYYGVGAAVRWDANDVFHIDSAVRVGYAGNDYAGRFYGASFSESMASYEASGIYGSVHIGAGFRTAMTDRVNAEVYGRYTFTYLEGDDVGLGTALGERFHMDDVAAHAFRVGIRFEGDFNPTASWRAGLAYEHVADGDADGDLEVSGIRYALDAPTVDGNTGILELGLNVKPSETSPWRISVGLKGYAGDREGVTGHAAATYAF